eukprot:92379-Prymnesium_polylepis.1
MRGLARPRGVAASLAAAAASPQHTIAGLCAALASTLVPQSPRARVRVSAAGPPEHQAAHRADRGHPGWLAPHPPRGRRRDEAVPPAPQVRRLAADGRALPLRAERRGRGARRQPDPQLRRDAAVADAVVRRRDGGLCDGAARPGASGRRRRRA